jgi:hypothetical protein
MRLGDVLPVEHIHTFLVHPGKGLAAAPQIGGTTVALQGKLFRLLENIYLNSDDECDIEISFNHDADGRQQNDCRDLITAYLQNPGLPRARTIAERLFKTTDKRSGLGLFFLIAGREGRNHKLVISRFPTDSAILAEEDERNLTVEFLERVFMKSATSYKAAVYQDSSLQAGFWLGKAVDKQINSRMIEVSNYWIFDFLASDFRLTAAHGTRRLGAALRNAARTSQDIGVKSELTAAVTLARGLGRRRISINEFIDHFGLSEAAAQDIRRQLTSPEIATEQFQFDLEEFKGQVGFRSVELSNGGILTADSGDFNEVFHREIIDDRTQEVKFSTTGRIVNEKLRKANE